MKKVLFYILSMAIILSSSFLFADEDGRLSDDTISKKKTGSYFTGLPLVNYSSDNGFGYGARIFFYNNDEKDSEFFAYQPYDQQVYIQYFATTGGWQYHELHLDKYNIFGSDFRLESSIVYDTKINANYYNSGADTTRYHLISATGTEYDTFKDYQSKFLESNNYANYKYNNYQYIKPTWYVSLYGKLPANFKYIAGFQIAKYDIETWDGEKFEAPDGKDYRNTGTTLLEAIQPLGYEGGWVNIIKVGLAYNTLDFEPDPTSGVNVDYNFETSQKAFGSDYKYYRHTAGARYYLPLGSDFVLATRIAYTSAQKDIPFYEMGYFAFPYYRSSGLGGNRSLRGYQSNRFVGPTMTMGNLEGRYKFAEITPGGQRFAFKVVAFYDIGNAYDKAGDPFSDSRWGDYRGSYGGGIVIAWNQATIIHIYYGMSDETSSLSIDFKHAIQ